MFLHFPQRIARQFFDDLEPPRDFERRQLFAAAGFERRQVARARSRSTMYATGISPRTRSGFAHHGGFGDLRLSTRNSSISRG